MSVKRLGLNSLWLLLARVLTHALMLAFVVLAARGLGVAVFGQFSAMTALLVLGNTITTFGTDTLLIRETARTGELAPLASMALRLQLVLSALWIGGVTSVAAVAPFALPQPRLALVVYLLALLPLAFYTIFSAVLRAFERMELFLALNLAAALLQTIGAAWLVRTQNNLVLLCAWLLVAQVVVAGVGGGLCLQYGVYDALRRPATLIEALNLIRAAWPLAALGAVALFSQRLSVLLLLPLAGAEPAGFFSAAARLVEGVKIGHYAVLGALLPVMSRRSAPDTSRLFRISRAVLLALSLLLALALTSLADPLVTLVYGSGYAPAAPVLRLLAWSLVPYAFSASLSLSLVARGAERVVLSATLLGMVLSVAGYAQLIPRLGGMGAAIGALVGESASAAALLWLRKRQRHVI